MFDREAQNGIYSNPYEFKWAIISLKDNRQGENMKAKNTFVSEFQKACQRSNLQISEPLMVEANYNANDWLQQMRNLSQADFFLLILPTKGKKKDDLNL